MQTNIEQLAAERILESGVKVSLPAPLFFRIVGKKTIKVVVKAPFRGTLLNISKKSLKAGFDLSGIDAGDMKEMHRLVVEHTGTMSEVLAVALLRSRIKIKLFTKLLAKWLTWHTTNRKMAEILLTVTLLSSPQDFTDSIRLTQSMRMTAPRNLSPTEQGSQQDEQKD